jgi:hypothetical protein
MGETLFLPMFPVEPHAAHAAEQDADTLLIHKGNMAVSGVSQSGKNMATLIYTITQLATVYGRAGS